MPTHMEFRGIRRVVELTGTHPDLRINGWRISGHALKRAVDMAMPYEEIIDIMSDPCPTEWHSDLYGSTNRAVRVVGKWAAVLDCAERLVITLLPHSEAQYDRSRVYYNSQNFVDIDIEALLGKIRSRER